MRFPILVFLFAFIGLSLCVKLGIFLRSRIKLLDKDDRDDFTLVQASTLTLMGIIIGFSFSMSVSRYDQRKIYEEEEANAIGTEYLRLDLLPAANTAARKQLLSKYLDHRIAWYSTRDPDELARINRDTLQVQADLWSTVEKASVGQPAAVVSLTVSGLNDVINSQGYTQAAWLNSIPPGAWILMFTVAAFGSVLIGLGAHKQSAFLFLVLPLVVSLALFLIADLDSPRGGLIRVRPQNLLSLSQSLNPR